MIALFFDTETNGVKSWDNPDFQLKIVQLGCIMQDTETKRVLAQINLVNSEVGDIPEGASKVHGISTEMAATIGVPKILIDKTFAYLITRADRLVAHNIQYDLDVLKDYMPDSWKVAKDKEAFCTMDSNVEVLKLPASERQKRYFSSKGDKRKSMYKSPSLMEAHIHYKGVGFEGAHDAMVDIEACRDVYFAMEVNQ